jgi:hypothetical protein
MVYGRDKQRTRRRSRGGVIGMEGFKVNGKQRRAWHTLLHTLGAYARAVCHQRGDEDGQRHIVRVAADGGGAHTAHTRPGSRAQKGFGPPHTLAVRVCCALALQV